MLFSFICSSTWTLTSRWYNCRINTFFLFNSFVRFLFMYCGSGFDFISVLTLSLYVMLDGIFLPLYSICLFECSIYSRLSLTDMWIPFDSKIPHLHRDNIVNLRFFTKIYSVVKTLIYWLHVLKFPLLSWTKVSFLWQDVRLSSVIRWNYFPIS